MAFMPSTATVLDGINLATLNSNLILQQLPRAARGNAAARTKILAALTPFVWDQAKRSCRKMAPTLDAEHDAWDIASISLSKLLPPDGQGGLFTLKNPLAMPLFVNRTVRSESVNLVRRRKHEYKHTTSLNQRSRADHERSLEDVTPDTSVVLPGSPTTQSSDQYAELSLAEVRSLLRECLAGLTSQEREAIFIRFQLPGARQAATFGKQRLVTVKDVADHMGVPAHDVNNWIHRGLKKLATRLKELGCRLVTTEEGLHLLQENSDGE